MATRYGYSRTFKAPGSSSLETFSVDSASSFDEAKKIVDRGIYERELEVKATQPVPETAKEVNKFPPTTGIGGATHVDRAPGFPS